MRALGAFVIILAALSGAGGAPAPKAPPPAEPAPSPRETATEHNNLGIALLAQFKPADAEKEFRQAVAADPTYMPGLVNVGVSLLAQSRYDDAIRRFEQALLAAPDDVHAHYNLSLIYKIQGKAENGIRHALQAVAGDPRDADLRYNLGALYQSARDYDKAIAAYESALKLDPNLLPAYYSLGRAYIAKGDLESGKRFIQRHQELQSASNLPSSSSGLKYGEQGRYSFAMEDESGRTAEAEPLAEGRINFVDATRASGITFSHAGGGDPGWLRSPLPSGGDVPALIRNQVAPALGSGVALADIDGDGLDDAVLLDTGGKPSGVFRNKGKMTFEPLPSAAAAIPAGAGMGVAAGDVDNDGDVDLLVTRVGGATLLMNEGAGAFKAASLPPFPEGFFAAGGSLADIDHDGDLDLFVAGMLAPPNPVRDTISFPADFGGQEMRVLRNSGLGSFTDITSSARFGDGSKRNVGGVFSDFDNDRDIDVAVARLGQGIALYRNNRDGTFAERGAAAGLPAAGNYLGLASGDYDRDGWVDLVATVWDSSIPRFFRNNGDGTFALDVGAAAQLQRSGAGPCFGVAFADVDDDGFLDVLVVNGTDQGPAVRLIRSLGSNGFEDATDVAGLGVYPARRGRGLAVGDLDGDGDPDLIVSNNGGPPTVLRNDGGNRNHWIAVAAKGLNSNRRAIGTKVEVKAGPLRQKAEIVSGSGYLSSGSLKPLFGIGSRTRVDALRLLWPGGVLQDEIRLAADTSHAVEELDRKGTSCPILYAWDGQKIAFVTDFLGGSAFGYLLAPASYNTPDTDEYVRIPPGRIRARGGYYEIRMNNQLEETIYFDSAQLLAVDHEIGTEVYPDEKLLPAAPYPPFRIHLLEGAHPPVSAIDGAGSDVTRLVAEEDRKYPEGFALYPFKGYAEKHTLTLDLGPIPASGAVLLLTAWIDYADSTSNLAAAQAGVPLVPPSLEALDPHTGKWIEVLPSTGFPAGLPKTMTVDLSGVLPAGATKVRITTSMCIYWDRILVAGRVNATPRVTRMDPFAAELRWRGFPLSVMPDGRPPALYDYTKEEPYVLWKAHAGWYTRFGDVRDLLLSADDRYVITRGGDEIAIAFDGSALPPLAEGETRTFFVYAAGFGKDMDLNSARPDRVEPLPYHAMPSFPYPDSAAYPLDEEAMRYIDEYNTRRVNRNVPPL